MILADFSRSSTTRLGRFFVATATRGGTRGGHSNNNDTKEGVATMLARQAVRQRRGWQLPRGTVGERKKRR